MILIALKFLVVALLAGITYFLVLIAKYYKNKSGKGVSHIHYAFSGFGFCIFLLCASSLDSHGALHNLFIAASFILGILHLFLILNLYLSMMSVKK